VADYVPETFRTLIDNVMILEVLYIYIYTSLFTTKAEHTEKHTNKGEGKANNMLVSKLYG